MEIDLFFVQENVMSKCLYVQHISGQVQWVGPLSPTCFMLIRGKLKVIFLSIDPHTPLVSRVVLVLRFI